jgi:hypothetical protein
MLGEQEGQLRGKRRIDGSGGQGGPSEGTPGLPDAKQALSPQVQRQRRANGGRVLKNGRS